MIPICEKVKRAHRCGACRKMLQVGDTRICMPSNYCIPCGYTILKKRIEEENRMKRLLEEKFYKELIVSRLLK